MKKLPLTLLVVVGLSACNGNGSNGSTTSNNALTPTSFVGNCTTIECKPGVILVTNANELMNTGKMLENIGQQKDSAQFSNNHFAVLVAPSITPYTMIEDGKPRAFNLGYNTQVLGVGKTMDDVVINPGVEAYNNPDDNSVNCFLNPENELCKQPGGLNNFWRGIENFTVTRPDPKAALIFAVSQAAPIRNIHFKDSDVLLCDWHAPGYGCGYTSGGFMANSIVDNALLPGSQQQWLSRGSEYKNTDAGKAEVAAWNSVFVGTKTTNPPAQDGKPFPYNEPADNVWQNYPVAYVSKTPISKEKPFLACTDTCFQPSGSIKWKVEVPKIRSDAIGIDDFKTNPPTELDVDSDFIILSPDSGVTSAQGITTLNKDEVDAINLALNQNNKNLIITPGVYDLDGGPIKIARNNTVVLGIGIPSLVCTNTVGCMDVSAKSGVDLAGFVMDAGYNLTPSLLQVGPTGITSSPSDDPANPIFLHDIYFRIAETQLSNPDPAHERQTVAAAIINASNVVGDNLWVWRADHDRRTTATRKVSWEEDRASYGLIVYGDNVSMNGLAVEHFRDYQTVWYGKSGIVNFYQSEMPYDVENLAQWVCHDPKTGVQSPVKGCASYVVDSNATNHTADGLGVYTYFRSTPIMARSAYIVPENIQGSGIVLNHLMGKWLDGNHLSGFDTLVTTPSAGKCLGFGVNYTPNDKTKSQYSVLGIVNSSLTKNCN